MLKWPLAKVKMMIRKILFAASAFVCPLAAFAQGDQRDLHLWTAIEVNHKLNQKVELSAQFQSRFDREVNRLRGNYFSIDASRKLGKGFRLLFDARFATSSQWDKYRFGIGLQKNIKFDEKGNTELKFRANYQYQFFPTADVQYGIYVPQQNFRIRASFNKKIIKKTYLTIQSEPMWRAEAGSFFFRRVRSTISVKRSLPGPWAIQVGYTRQFNFNNPADIQIVSASLSYEFKRKPKAKTLPFNPVPAQQ
jgi:hypothetical protein